MWTPGKKAWFMENDFDLDTYTLRQTFGGNGRFDATNIMAETDMHEAIKNNGDIKKSESESESESESRTALGLGGSRLSI